MGTWGTPGAVCRLAKMRYGSSGMLRPAPQLKAFKRQGVAVLVLLLCFGAYYALVVRTQTNYFTNRDFRVLAAMGDQIRAVIANLGSSITNAAMPPARLPDHDTNGSPFLAAWGSTPSWIEDFTLLRRWRDSHGWAMWRPWACCSCWWASCP
jgi:hypothetical protein